MRSASAHGVFLALTLFGAQTAAAQDASCEPISDRPAVIVGLDVPHILESRERPARGPATVRAAGEIRVIHGVGVRVEVDRSILPVNTGAGPDWMVTASHTSVGIVHHQRTGDLFCGYAALTAGVHRFLDHGYRSSSRGLSGTVGVYLASEGRVNPFLEMSLSAFRGWLEVYDSLSLTGGLRFRF
jgi:hypothetical protein